jgi:hypothetical protein
MSKVNDQELTEAQRGAMKAVYGDDANKPIPTPVKADDTGTTESTDVADGITDEVVDTYVTEPHSWSGDDGSESVSTTEAVVPTEGVAPQVQSEAVSDKAPSEESTATPVKKGVQKRFDKLTKKVRGLERDAENFKSVVQRQEALIASQSEKLKSISGSRPEEGGFKDEEQYNEAVSDWRVKKQVETSSQEAEKQRRADMEIEGKKLADDRKVALSQLIEKKKSEAVASHPDFDRLVLNNPNIAITPEMLEPMVLSDNFAEIARYLGQNTELSLSIASLSPAQAALEIARIDGRIDYQLSQPPPNPKTPKAPPPVNTVRGASSSRSHGEPVSGEGLAKKMAQWDKESREKRIRGF